MTTIYITLEMTGVGYMSAPDGATQYVDLYEVLQFDAIPMDLFSCARAMTYGKGGTRDNEGLTEFRCVKSVWFTRRASAASNS